MNLNDSRVHSQHSLNQVHLTLFFTHNLSLHDWDRLGLLEREIAIYQALRPKLAGLTFVTYGDHRDRAYTERMNGIEVICNLWRLPMPLYPLYLQLRFLRRKGGIHILKSNQIWGAEVPLRLAQRLGHIFLARCGYLPSNIMKWRYGPDSERTLKTRQLEEKVFHAAHYIMVTTEAMKKALMGAYRVPEEKISVVPNYVDTHRFVPRPDLREPNRVVYVGRLEPEKNLMALLRALEGLNVTLDVVGTGRLESDLRDAANRMGLRVRFHGTVPHSQIPEILNRASVFVLPSFLEHHPKALLEAMACGLAVIGSQVPGIQELIQHGQNGWLCKPDAPSLREGIMHLMGDETLRAELGEKARRFVVEHFSLDRVLRREIDALQRCLEIADVTPGSRSLFA